MRDEGRTYATARHMTGVVTAFLTSVGIMWLGGCAISNEGAIDYRQAELPSKELATSAMSKDNDPLVPAALVRKDLASSDVNAKLEKLDKISVRLREGFLRDCNEWPNPLRRLRKNCEIAILFRAFELGEGQDFKFQPGAERDARLVYFSHDVEPGQPFNLHNMPVYGPLEYKGKPLGLDIFIIEIDAEDKQAFALLKALATVGATAYPPAAPVLGVLEKLGASLISSGTDDSEWRYSMVLDPSGGYSGNTYAIAAAGDYVFIREENRSTETPWHELAFDHNTGRVWVKAKQGGKAIPYTANTYLTVQILKNAGTDDVMLAQNTYGPFRDAIEKANTARAEEIETSIVPALKNLALSRVRIRNFNESQKLYEGLLADLKDNNSAEAANKAFKLCQSLMDTASKLASSDSAVKETAGLDAEQFAYLLDRLRRNAKMTDADKLLKFSTQGFPQVAIKECMDAAKTAVQ